MKKRILALLLSLGVAVAGLPAEVMAAGAVQEAGEAAQEAYEDLSDRIIQEGGFLPETEERAGAALESGKREQARQAILAAWDSFSNSCDLSAYQIPVADFREIYVETLNKNPRYFYVSGQWSYSLDGNGVREVFINYGMSPSEAKTMRDAYDRAVAVAVRGAQASWSDMEKALYINDYLARNCEYDGSFQKYTAYDALVGRTAVCQGYALAFLELAQQLGLSCEMVSSASINHAWNMVKLDGSYYNVDVTWNDPVTDQLGRACHAYFMKSTAFFKHPQTGMEPHLGADDWAVSGGVKDTAASNAKYDNYFWNQANVGFDYIDGAWYGFDGNDSICKYSCNGADFTSLGTVQQIADVWMVLGSDGSYWQEKFVGTGSFNGKYYYSGRDSIYELDAATGKSAPVFTLTEAQKQRGSIYGMNVSASGELQYILAESPGDAGEVLTAAKLEQPHTHTEEIRDAAAATCQKEGYTGDVYCRECGALLKKGSAIEKKEHTPVVAEEAIPATCAEAGRTEGKRCKECGQTLQEPEIIPALGHDWEKDYAIDKPATAEEEGEKSIHCSRCPQRKDIQTIPKLEPGEIEKMDLSACEITLAPGRYVYDGRPKEPVVTVWRGDAALTPSSDYQTEYKDNIHAGTASVIISGKGIYTGSVTKTFQIQKAANRISGAEKYTKTSKKGGQTFKLNIRAAGGTIAYQSQNKSVKISKDGKVTIPQNFVGKAVIQATAGSGDYASVTKKITVTVNPAGVTLTQARNASGRKLALKWKKNAQASGYQMQYSASPKFSGAKSKLISGASRTKYTLSGLKKKTTYYVRIRAYKTVGKVKYYSGWSGAKKCVIQK